MFISSRCRGYMLQDAKEAVILAGQIYGKTLEKYYLTIKIVQ